MEQDVTRPYSCGVQKADEQSRAHPKCFAVFPQDGHDEDEKKRELVGLSSYLSSSIVRKNQHRTASGAVADGPLAGCIPVTVITRVALLVTAVVPVLDQYIGIEGFCGCSLSRSSWSLTLHPGHLLASLFSTYALLHARSSLARRFLT